MTEFKVPDYTTDTGMADDMTVKSSPVNDFKYVDSIEFDQTYEDVPQRKVLAVPSNTGGDIFGRIESNRSLDEGFYKIIIPSAVPGVDFDALVIETFIGGAGGGGTYFKFGYIEQLPGAAPGGNIQMVIPGYPYMPDLPNSNPGPGYLYYDPGDGNTVKMGS